MSNPIKTWFFELIEDAIGSKAMKQFKKEEENMKLKPLSDRIVIMNKGNIVQIDNPKNIYDNPSSKFAANFIGESNILNIDSLKI